MNGEVVACSGGLPAKQIDVRERDKMVKDFFLPLQYVDTIDLQSVRCSRRRWHEKSPVKFVKDLVTTSRERSKRDVTPDHASNYNSSAARSDVPGHDTGDTQRETENLRRWLHTYGSDRQCGAVPFG